MNQRESPQGPKHEDDVMARQVFQHAPYQRRGIPRLAFGRAEFCDGNLIGFCSQPRFGFQRHAHILNEQIMSSGIARRSGDNRIRLLDSLERLFDEGFEIYSLRWNGWIDRMMDVDKSVDRNQKSFVKDTA